jgi:hypothetical protein
MLGMDEFLDYNNFYLAFKRLQTVSFDYYKELYKPDLLNYGLDLERNIKATILSIKKGTYSPSEVNKIYLPKPNRLVRPISVLDFQDLLIYQALINVIAESFYDDFKKYYNKFLFGNVYNKTNDDKKKIFFYVKWQEQWGKFLAQTKLFYKQGYIYLAEFDIASFYDTIDHKVLADFLKEKVDTRIVQFLLDLLSVWTVDPDRLNKQISHGIPQGPQASGFLSEIYLSYIDHEFINKIEKMPIKYIRYADDIRIFAKDPTVAERYLVYLDLLARDIGLIPQTGKIQTMKIKSVHELSKMADKFSQITPNYSGNYFVVNEGSKQFSRDETKGEIAKLASSYKANRGLNVNETKELLSKVFKTLDEDDKPDKTILRFALYRLGPNNQLRDKLIKYYEKLWFIFEDVCMYLSKHFVDCDKVKNWIYSLLEDKDLVYHYPIALIFKYFKEIIEFNHNLFERFYKLDKTKHWYIKYFMLDWLEIKNPNLILSLEHESENNSRIKKKLLGIKYRLTTNKEEKLNILRLMLSSENVNIALQGLYIYINETSYDSISGLFDKLILINPFIYSLISSIENEDSYIENTLLRLEGIFNKNHWTTTEYKTLAKMIVLIRSLENLDTHLWINSVDRLNFFLLAKYLYLIDGSRLASYDNKVYENILNNQVINEIFPLAVENFATIHKKKKSIESNDDKLTFYELDSFVNMEINAIREIADNSSQRIGSLFIP